MEFNTENAVDIIREALSSLSDGRAVDELVETVGVVVDYATADDDDVSVVDSPTDGVRALLELVGRLYVERGDARGLESVARYFLELSDYVDGRRSREDALRSLETVNVCRRETTGNDPTSRALRTLRSEYRDDLETLVDEYLCREYGDVEAGRLAYDHDDPARARGRLRELVEGADRTVRTSRMLQTLLATSKSLSECWSGALPSPSDDIGNALRATSTCILVEDALDELRDVAESD
jgi:hypothetical protein